MKQNPEKGKGEGRCRSADSAETERLARRVLVVDDDPDAVEALAELLSMSGHEVRIATAADEALRLFETLQPQVAVLDIGLPVMNGYELQVRMCELRGGRDCVYVALTGYGMKSEQEQSRRAGFRAHLVKPVRLEQLMSLIEASGGSAPSAANHPDSPELPDAPDSEAGGR
jgi:CheY-like chemotaxis protein